MDFYGFLIIFMDLGALLSARYPHAQLVDEKIMGLLMKMDRSRPQLLRTFEILDFENKLAKFLSPKKHNFFCAKKSWIVE